MLEILKDTDRRLVMTLGQRRSRWTKFILDKDAGRVWFEQRRRFLPQRTLEIAFADIAAIGTPANADGRTAAGAIMLTTVSQGIHWIAGERGFTQAAADRLRAFIGLENVELLHLQRTRPLRLPARRLATAAVVLAVAVTAVWCVAILAGPASGAVGKIGGLVANATERMQSGFLLPACDAPQSREVIHDLVRDRLGQGALLGDIAQAGQDGGERLCNAIARRDGRTATVAYRNYWDGWTPKVRLTGEIVTDKLDAARTAAITSAAEAFLATSRNSHRSGNPPRQTDPAVDQSLAVVFGASDLAAEPLAADEIDKALQWLKIADRIGSAYLLAGTGYDDFARVPQTEVVQRRMRGNVTAFADEFGRYADFQMIVLAAIANAEMRALPANARAGQSQTDEIRARLSQAMKSGFIACVYDGHNDAWRMARLTALGRTAPVAARFLTKDDARAVRDLALQAVGYFKDATVRAKVREIAGLMSAP